MRFLTFILFLLLSKGLQGQTALHWSDLSAGISWELPSSEMVFAGFQTATFSPEMKALEGNQVVIIGYLLVLDGNQSVFLLSKNPMASCFFCGNGGPETIVDLKFSEKPSFKMDELLSVTGTLYLNENNPNASYYRIENASATSFE